MSGSDRNEPAARRERVWAIARDIQHQLHGSFYEQPARVTPFRLMRVLLTPELQGVAWYRVSHAMWSAGFRKLSFFPYLKAKRLGCDISAQARIGAGLRVVHAMDVVIGAGAVVGRDVVLFNGVTLGNRNVHGAGDGMPVVGDRVMIGAGAKILGPIRIGDDARIGANAVVLVDVAAGAAAVGNPARVVGS